MKSSMKVANLHPNYCTSTTVPSLEKCFNAIEKELSDNGDSLRRINKDISTEDLFILP